MYRGIEDEKWDKAKLVYIQGPNDYLEKEYSKCCVEYFSKKDRKSKIFSADGHCRYDRYLDITLEQAEKFPTRLIFTNNIFFLSFVIYDKELKNYPIIIEWCGKYFWLKDVYENVREVTSIEKMLRNGFLEKYFIEAWQERERKFPSEYDKEEIEDISKNKDLYYEREIAWKIKKRN